MVKKLLKYEFISFAKTILPMEIILLGIAVLTRFIQFFEDDSVTYRIFSISSVVALVISCIVCLVMTVFVNLIRFYRNLYTGEGYLTLTLPVTHHQHILSKLIAAVCSTIFSVISILLAIAISTAGEVFHELLKAFGYLFGLFTQKLGADAWLYVLEFLILALLMTTSEYLLCYGCITVGQMAKKNRVLAAFGVFFGYYMFGQVLSTVLLVITGNFYKELHLDELLRWFSENPRPAAHIILISLSAFAILMGCIYYLITHKLMKQKLNLE